MLESWKVEDVENVVFEKAIDLASSVFNISIFSSFSIAAIWGVKHMDANRLAEILKKRAENHVTLFSIGGAMSTIEARELEQLGHGELRGGDGGIFWLYPASGNYAVGEFSRRAGQEPEKSSGRKRAGRGRAASAPVEVDAQQIQWPSTNYRRRGK